MTSQLNYNLNYIIDSESSCYDGSIVIVDFKTFLTERSK